MSTTSARASLDVVYPACDPELAEHELQAFITELLRPLIQQLSSDRGVFAHAGRDTFFYWREGDTKTRVAPDVYVIDGVAQSLRMPSWQTWVPGQGAPSVAIEVVGNDVQQDYDRSPSLYDELGARELIVFDPHMTVRSARRMRWQRWLRALLASLKREP